MFTGASASGGGGVDALVAIAEAIKDPNFKAKVAELQAREKAANDAEVSAQARIDAAAAQATQVGKREDAVKFREEAQATTNQRQAQAKAYLDSREEGLKQREAALALAQNKLAMDIAASEEARAKAEADHATRVANANAALDKRANDLAAREATAAKAQAEADVLRKDYEARVARLKQAVA